jgi:hypothetical protein
MRLTKQDFSEIQAHIDLTRNQLGEHGLTLHVDHDMHAFVDYIGRQEETHGVPSSHNPAKCYLHPGNSFWVYVRHAASGDIIGCQAQRLMVTDDFVQDCLAQTLFENLTPSLDAPPLGTDDSVRVLIAGRVMYGGGLYIRPDWRSKGLLIFNRVSRTIALRHFQADYFCGLQLNTQRRRAMALTGFAFAHVVPFIQGGLPGKPYADDVQLSWSSRQEWLEAIRRELANQDAGRYTPRRTRAPSDPLREAAAAGTRA